MVTVHYARRKISHILTSWIYHLALCCQAPPDHPPISFLICKDSALKFDPVPQSNILLENLLDLFRRGLEQPIHFFPDTSHEYARCKLVKATSDQAALAKAGIKWHGGEGSRKFNKPESDNPNYDQCFRRMDALDEEFKEIALEVFTPLIANSKEIIL
jgi:exodeoxyribonuclease V gamma subunit